MITFSCYIKYFRVLDYEGIFGSALVLNIINLVYVSIFVKETRGPRRHPKYAAQHDHESKTLFSLNHMKSVFETALKHRPKNMRTVLLMLIGVMLLSESVFSK